MTVNAGIAHVVLSRPPVNAVTQDMYEEIRAAFGSVADSSERVKVVVLSGEGRHFCAGNDLHEFSSLTSENSPLRMLAVRRAFWAIYDCPVPVIAAVHGAVLGTGLALAASCDFIIAARSARIALPEIQVGVMGGVSHLRRLVPEPLARWMFLTGTPAPLDLLEKLGSVLEVVEGARLLEAAYERASIIATHSGVALRIAKRTLNATEWLALKPGYEFEQARTGDLVGYSDSIEARKAALEQRLPRYGDDSAELESAAHRAFV